ncbi:MAG: hypothetical protein KatS3mg026_1306 [Bacteroidia bacterium]|nr:MAG: hypothetical protein KatS3mg026_1306 [Bacteroidia bacterium]
MDTLLVVDDEPTVVEALIAQLAPLGVWIEGALSAEEAFSLLDQHPAVVIADYLMPGMKGDAFLIQVRQRLPHARLILLTGQAGAENVGRVVNEAGLFRYIPKPWDVGDLRLTVQQALQSYHTEELLRERQRLSHLLLKWVEALLACQKLEALPALAQEGTMTLFDRNYPLSEAEVQTLSPPAQEAWTLFSRMLDLRRAHLELLADLENQVQERTAHLAASLQELKALSSQREAWIKIVSHDLRGPLSGLRQLASLLQAGPISAENLKKYAQLLEKSLAELETYVKNLLDLTRLSQKEIALEFGFFSWEAMSQRLYALLAPQLELKQIRWQAEVPSQAQGWGDPTYATEALYNLLSNAVKFTPRGGSVFFRVEPGPRFDGVEVRDTGVGMTPQELERLWDPTRRRSRVGTAGEKGTGLGLPLAKAILDQHQVTVEVESEPGKGTTFRLKWPKP